MSESMIIIGAGIAGLAAGCYAQMNGYRSQIFELHDIPGGLCTAWTRKDYVLDGCIHYLFGSGKGQPFYQVWEDLGALVDRPVINHTEFMQVQDLHGQTLQVFADPKILSAHMKTISPADASLIDDLAEGVERFTKFDMSILQAKPKPLMTSDDWRVFGMQMMPYLGPLAKWGLVTAGDFAARFKDPFLRRAVAQMFAWPEIPMMAGLSLLAYMHTQNAGFPAGGSLEFARAVERRYLALGGEIHYKSQVEKILVENDKAVGVRLYNDEIYYADQVISTADGRSTIYEMLDGAYTNKKINRLYNGEMPIRSHLLVSLGLKKDLSHLPHWITYLLDEPLLIAGDKHHEITVKHYCFDPSLAPEGHSVVQVMLPTSYGYWQRIYGRRLYDTEQLQVADIAIDFLEKVYDPEIKEAIVLEDVATPLSYERFTGNWLGSTCGWLLTTDTMKLMITGLDKTLPGLQNFYLAGQWVEPGGSVPLAAMSGRGVIQLICHSDGKAFHSTAAEKLAA